MWRREEEERQSGTGETRRKHRQGGRVEEWNMKWKRMGKKGVETLRKREGDDEKERETMRKNRQGERKDERGEKGREKS